MDSPIRLTRVVRVVLKVMHIECEDDPITCSDLYHVVAERAHVTGIERDKISSPSISRALIDLHRVGLLDRRKATNRHARGKKPYLYWLNRAGHTLAKQLFPDITSVDVRKHSIEMRTAFHAPMLSLQIRLLADLIASSRLHTNGASIKDLLNDMRNRGEQVAGLTHAYSSIQKLVDKGYVTSLDDKNAHSRRYVATNLGEQELREWVIQQLPQMQRLCDNLGIDQGQQ